MKPPTCTADVVRAVDEAFAPDLVLIRKHPLGRWCPSHDDPKGWMLYNRLLREANIPYLKDGTADEFCRAAAGLTIEWQDLNS
jgi:hypothetical protein